MANSATLTKAMLDDLHKGNAAISLLPYTKGGVALPGLDFENADQVFTEQDSFTLAPADPSTNAFRVDQYDEIIDFDFENGDWTINGNIPSWATEVFDYFFNAGEDISGDSKTIKGQEGIVYSGKGYKEAKEIEVSVLVESKSKKTAIVLGHVKIVVNPPAIDDHQKPGYVKFVGYVLANGTYSKFGVLKAAA